MIRKTLSLQNESGEDIHFDLRFEEGTKHAPLILILHGFKGFKDWGFFPDLARTLTYSGYVTLTMNFSRNGIGADHNKFTELERFASNTYAHELSDVSTVLQAIRDQQIGRNVVNPERVGIIGHSRGGAVALLSTLDHQEQIGALVTWSSIAYLNRYSEEQIDQWNKQGYIEIENSRTHQIMRINKTFWEDIVKNKDRYDLLGRIGELSVPALFIHGDADESVPCSESEQLFERCGSSTRRLELIEDAGHTFGIRHPFEVRTRAYEMVLDLTEHWFDNNLIE